jgi:hypothetical protein
VRLKTTYAIRGGAFRQVTLTVPVDTSCNTTCAGVGFPSRYHVACLSQSRVVCHVTLCTFSQPHAFPKLLFSPLASIICTHKPRAGVDEACTSTDGSGSGGGGGGGGQACKLACSCAFGVDFGASVCGYANTVRDVADARAALLGGSPGFAAALDIYQNGKYAFKDDGVTKRTM